MFKKTLLAIMYFGSIAISSANASTNNIYALSDHVQGNNFSDFKTAISLLPDASSYSVTDTIDGESYTFVYEKIGSMSELRGRSIRKGQKYEPLVGKVCVEVTIDGDTWRICAEKVDK
ncbi:hypothetical protein ACMAZF_05165 [Psychrobium sp. nBUS_13]|uniref:hypothetical protein n=1 Tax=Psychrobium sp. nBUS_13 TaxID=3395319 RepID=UPI003EBF30FA